MVQIQSAPAPFSAAVEKLRAAHFRSELRVREIAAPEGIAPHAMALAAGVLPAGAPHDNGVNNDGPNVEGAVDSPHGSGRLVLLHDPASVDEWGGPFRIICYAQAPLEVELGVDPFIADVTWSWLIDALDSRGAEYTYASGTATKTLSTGFGALEAEGDGAQIELRASWTPRGTEFAAHAEAWSELLCLLAGLPQHEGVASLGSRRIQHRTAPHGTHPRG